MVQPGTLKFLTNLTANNNKEWFDENRLVYAAVKADVEALVATLLDKLYGIIPELRDQKAKDCIFRIFRDVRFSKDKTPYKNHFGIYFSKGGRKFPGAGLYLHIEPGGKSFAGGGLWMPEPAMLKAVRQEIDYNFDEFQAILGNKKFKKLFGEIQGEKLKTLPQGYTADNPAIGILKHKSFTVGHNFTDKEMTGKGFVPRAVEVFTEMKGLVDFLNRGLV